MNWFVALIVLKVIAAGLNVFLGVIIESFATYSNIVFMVVGCTCILRMFTSWLWLVFTSRRYWNRVPWNLFTLFRIIASCSSDYIELNDLVPTINSYGLSYGIDPVVIVGILIVLNIGLYWLYYRKNKIEFEKEQQLEAKKASEEAAAALAKEMNDLQEKRNMLCNGQRPDADDYGYSKENPICTSTIDSSCEYLSRLRTLEGEDFHWRREGSNHLAMCNNVRNVMVDTYMLYLHGKPFKRIYICPYGHNSSYAPNGLMLANEKVSVFGGDLELEARERNLSIDALLTIIALDSGN